MKTTIAAAKEWVDEHDVELYWQQELGQYYGELSTPDGISYLWMEDAQSLGEKLSVMNRYGIAGVAHWKLGLETEDVWEVIGEYVNK